MHRQWLTEEEEAKRLAALINNGTDRELAQQVEKMSSSIIKSQATHVTKDGGSTPLHMAAVKERLEGLEAMHKHNVDFNSRDGRGESPLHTCLNHNAMSAARQLVSYGADVNELVCRQRKETILHRMVKADRLKAVDLLLEYGAATNVQTRDGDTPLHYAARYNRPQMARHLVEVGSEMNVTNQAQETALHVAVANRSFDVAKFLIKSKASVIIPDKQGMTALHAAVVGGYVDLAKLMLTANSTHVNSKELLLGRTPLLLACAGDSHKMAPLLLLHGADANLTSNYRKSVLHEAASRGNTHALNAVIKHATNLNALSTNNKTPLHCAVKEGRTDAAKVLLKAGVNANLKDIEGNTALHMASSVGDTDMLGLLLQHGVFVNATNMQRQSPLHLAYMAGHEESGWILIQAGCDKELIDIHEKQAHHYLDEFYTRLKEEGNQETARTSSRVTFSNVLDEFYALNCDEMNLITTGSAPDATVEVDDVPEEAKLKTDSTDENNFPVEDVSLGADATSNDQTRDTKDNQYLTSLYVLSLDTNEEDVDNNVAEGNLNENAEDDDMHYESTISVEDLPNEGENSHKRREGKDHKLRRSSKTKHRRNSATSPRRLTKTAGKQKSHLSAATANSSHNPKLDAIHGNDFGKHDNSHHSKLNLDTVAKHTNTEGRKKHENKGHQNNEEIQKKVKSSEVANEDAESSYSEELNRNRDLADLHIQKASLAKRSEKKRKT